MGRMSALAVLLALGAWNAPRALAGIEIVSESAVVDHDAGLVRFSVEFDEQPDFWTKDEFGRLADSFQYEVDGDWQAPLGLPPEGLDAVVRGDEIHVADALRIRDAGFDMRADGDPNSGGWGDVRATVPFNLDGTRLSFEASLADLGDDGDGYFAYRVFTTEFGLTTSELEMRLLPPGELPPGQEPPPGPGTTPIPLPGPLKGVAVTAAVLGVGWVLRQRGLPLR